MRLKRSAFTLMELVVVVAILAGLAGLVINKVDWIRPQANMAIGAEASGDVAQNIQTFIASTERLPNVLDSLLNTGTNSFYSGPNYGSGTSLTSSGGGIIGISDGVGNIPSQCTPVTITYNSSSDKRLNSLFRVGMMYVNDHDSTSNANDSGTVQRAIGSISGGQSTFTSANLVLVKTSAKTSSIWANVYPPNVWPSSLYQSDGVSMQVNSAGTTVSLVALGVGPYNSMIGNTLVSPPQYPGPDSNIYYYRYVAIFAVYSDGSRAQLKTVVDPYGRTIDSSIQQYSTSGPDNIPPGSRTPE